MSDQNPRSDSKLKRLPIAVICELVTRCQTPGVTQAEALAWLKREHGVAASASALSQSYTYLVSRAAAHDREQKIGAWMDAEKLEHPELSDEELFRRGQRKFTLMTIAEEDPKGWAMIQKTARDKEAVSLDRQKFQRETCELFVKWLADKRAKDIASSDTTNADKIEKLGQLMFGDDWKQ